MHEYHSVESLVKTILATAKRQQASRITRVSLVMGELCGFEESSVRLYLENLSQGTLLEGVDVHIRHQPAELLCRTCNKTFPAKKHNFSCPVCGTAGACRAAAAAPQPNDPGDGASVVCTETGKEFYVENIEIESA
jgi:hydrogenase nickel incorporation protein HypA/HybF